MEAPMSNEQLKKLRRLDRKKVRQELGLQLLEGPRLVLEGLSVGCVSAVFCREDGAGRWREQSRGVPVHVLSRPELDRLADVKTPQDVVAVGPLPARLGVEELCSRHRKIVILDGVQDPGNVGSITRTALALGVSGLVAVDGSCDLTAPKVLRASAGALLRLDLASAPRDLAVSRWDHTIVLPVVRGGVDIREVDPPDTFALVLGNEAAGASIDPAGALRVTIPMPGPVESLNGAAACAAILGRWV